jgi:DNA-binding transcriptional LysR family regulator
MEGISDVAVKGSPVNITQLQRFVAVAEHLHFPRAAEALGIPLPSLYSSMDKLEAEVGHPLFTNTKNGPILSPAGTLLLDEAKRQIAAAPALAEKPKVPIFSPRAKYSP